MRNKHQKPAMSVWQPNDADLKEIYLLEGMPMITPELIRQLIAKGWQSWKFDEIETFAPRCKHGKIVAYYSERRDSILIPGNVEGVEITYEITRSQIHLHTLTASAAQQARAGGRNARTC